MRISHMFIIKNKRIKLPSLLREYVKNIIELISYFYLSL